MNIVTEIHDFQELRQKLANKSIGFVPTMGHLHSGHLSLCERSLNENDITVVSIFVNPTQFNQSDDFEKYPRSVNEDKELLSSLSIDYLFIPDATKMYPDNYQFQIQEKDLSSHLEGEFRPGHFSGMLTIVLKLFNIVRPSKAYFGEKDYQQLLLIQKMVEAMFLPIEIVPCETIRAEDGLALSSRNSRLNAQQRQQAKHFPRLLNSSLNLDEIISALNQLDFKIDYITEMWGRRLGAVWLDDIRLIDNFQIKQKAG